MRVKLIAENDEERAKLKEVEHQGVQEFFVFGVRKDGDGEAVDFYDWNGSYRYLIGSLSYYLEVVKNNYKNANSPSSSNTQEVVIRPEVMSDVQESPNGPMIKTGETNPIQVLKVEDFNELNADLDGSVVNPQKKVLDPSALKFEQPEEVEEVEVTEVPEESSHIKFDQNPSKE